MFSRRAERLLELAPGHELEGFLRTIAVIVAAQHGALRGLPPGTLPAQGADDEGPPLDPARLKRDATWRAALSSIVDAIDRSALPAPAEEARAWLAAAAPEALEALADRYLQGDMRPADTARLVFVAAALQVAWTRQAALLDAGRLDPADAGTCPACASPPVAGVVAPGGTKFGHRHLHCSLCATAWRYTRTRCIHCGSTDKVSFRQLAGTTYLRAECCEACHGYSKVFYLEKAKPVEALADDLASLGLDVLVGEEGFSRVPNPFVLGVMSGGSGDN